MPWAVNAGTKDLHASYTGSSGNSIDTKENMIHISNFQKDWKNAVQHNIPVSATFTLNYLQIFPSFNYRERWYTNKIEKEYDSQKQSLVAAIRPTDFIVSMITMLPFRRPPLSTDSSSRCRSLETSANDPSQNGTIYQFQCDSDFGSSRYGYYRTYVYQDANGVDHTEYYSPFANGCTAFQTEAEQEASDSPSIIMSR